MKDVEHTTPIKNLRKVLNTFKPKLYVANVDTEHYVEITEAISKRKSYHEWIAARLRT
jgi:hypothetical protein